jgi:hypothetical protein
MNDGLDDIHPWIHLSEALSSVMAKSCAAYIAQHASIDPTPEDTEPHAAAGPQ